MMEQLSPKVMAIYKAIADLLTEGADLNNMTVSEITGKAGIGKGTAYEYFSNKEDMIAGALFWELKMSCQELEEQMNTMDRLEDKLAMILKRMVAQMTETNCFFRVIRIMQDNSVLSKKMQELWFQKDKDEMLFTDLLRRMVDREIGATQDNLEKRIFLYMTVFSQIISFAMYLNDAQTQKIIPCQRMQEMICESVSQSLHQ